MLVRCPLLIIAFNRPDLLSILLGHLSCHRFSSIYFAVDGPRNAEESILVKTVQDKVNSFSAYNEKYTLFRNYNAGLRKGVSEAINWFFHYNKYGMILEDDCIPNSDFFEFCNLGLEKYENDLRVGMITGTNYFSDLDSYSPFLSSYPSIWGWATWASRWKLYSRGYYLKNPVKSFISLLYISRSPAFALTLLSASVKNKKHKLNTWDYQWVSILIDNNMHSLTPPVNLINNIGSVGQNGYETTENNFMQTYSFDCSLHRNEKLKLNRNYDKLIYTTKYKSRFTHYIKSLLVWFLY